MSVCYPIWSCDFSDFVIGLGEQMESERESGIDHAFGNLYFSEENACLALFELRQRYQAIIDSSMIDPAAIDNVILLNPYRDKSDLNVNVFNRNLQHLLNPPQEGIAEMARDRSLSFRPGDKVMQMRNTESARNGDTGYILRIERSADPDAPQEELLQAVVEFNHDGIEHVYTRDTIRDLDLAYCTTIHKSQGSEYQTVIMVLSAQHKAMLRRNLIYTGVTRAKESVAIITEEEKITAGGKGNAPLFTAVEAAIYNNKTDKRNSLLGLRLKTAAESLKQ